MKNIIIGTWLIHDL